MKERLNSKFVKDNDPSIYLPDDMISLFILNIDFLVVFTHQ